MRLHFIAVPVLGGGAAEQELNQFLASHRVVGVDRHLVADGARSAWAVCVAYVEPSNGAPHGATNDPTAKKRVDYRDILPAAEFQVFAKLRELRKEIAEHEGVPPYAVFSNEQLAAMVQRKIRSATELGAIEGVGPARLQKYGVRFLGVLGAEMPSAAVSS